MSSKAYTNKLKQNEKFLLFYWRPKNRENFDENT